MASELTEWYGQQYLEAAGLKGVEYGPKMAEYISKFPHPPNATVSGLPTPSGRFRMRMFLSLKLRYPLGAVNYECVAMTAQIVGRQSDNPPHAKYSYIYWRQDADAPEYIVVAPTYESRDGEYRPRLFTMANFDKIYDRYSEILSVAEAEILDLVKLNHLRLQCLVFPHSVAESRVDYVNSSRLMIRALAMGLLVDGAAYKNGYLPFHYNVQYVEVLKRIYGWRPTLLATAFNPKMAQMRIDVSRGKLGAGLFDLSAGKKLVPMTAGALMNPTDLGLASWRELALSQAASDLVVNFICGGFAIHGAWALVQGIDEGAFENEAMLELYARSRRTDVVMSSIREARRGLAGESANDRQIGALNADLYRSLEYAQKYCRLSSTGLLHIMEHVGNTLETWPAMIRRTKVVWPVLLDTFGKDRIFTRMLFDLCYAAQCLHTKIGAAHTDLHVNNMTLYMWGSIAEIGKEGDKAVFADLYENPIVAFVTGPRGEADTYMLPATGTTACIIDFSRAILGPGFRDRLDEAQASSVYRDQSDRALRALARYAGRVVKDNQAVIRAAIIAKFETVFPILCAVDFIAIGRNVGELFDAIAKHTREDGDTREIACWPGAVPECRRLEQFAENWMLEQLHALVDAAGQNIAYAAPPFPGDAVLAEMFAKWRFPSWVADPAQSDRAALVDAYNYTRPLQYSSHDYARFPPWAQLAEIEKHLGSVKMEDLFERGVEPFLASLEESTLLQDVSAEARAAEAKIDGPPPPVDPLWAPRDHY
jgi:hypothetical protein